LHSVCLSVCLSVRPVPGSTFVIGQRHPCGCVVSFVLFTFAAPHTVSAISRTSLFYHESWQNDVCSFRAI